nr:glycosyltransferase [Aquabacterium parvum]
MGLRVLQVCPFDIPNEPSTGGQIRIEAIARAYREAGCIVDRSCIVTRQRDARRPMDLIMPWLDRVRRKHIGKPDNLGQIRQHWAAQASQKLHKQLSSCLEKPYQIVHVEHPWGMALMRSMRRHPMLTNARIVYSAHNIEHTLFESVAREQGNWNWAARTLTQEIRRIEEAAAAEADITWAVSLADAGQLMPFAKRCVVAPNGCRELPKRACSSVFTRLQGRYALFIGTNYSPNVNGFLRMLEDDFSFLPPGTSIQTIGTCVEALSHHAPHRHWQKSERLHHHGKVSGSLLDSALLNAGVIILPILSGGGTNLKTAEALASGRLVLGTTKAFRGFEDWLHAPGVHFADAPESFRDNLAKLLLASSSEQSKFHRQGLNWTSALQPALQETLGGAF